MILYDDAIITSLWRQNDVVKSSWCHNDVIIALCVGWVGLNFSNRTHIESLVCMWHCDTSLFLCKTYAVKTMVIMSVCLQRQQTSHDFLLGYKTRRSENDNTPQPLDQWTNSPFTGQQVGNCKSFTLTHYLADLFVMLHGPRSIPLCIQHHIQFTSLSFQVSQTSHYWVTAICIFNLENLRSRSWVRSKFEVTMWV